jgi:hypothetical protein
VVQANFNSSGIDPPGNNFQGMLDVPVFHDITEILLKVALNTIALTPGCFSKLMAFLTPEIYS